MNRIPLLAIGTMLMLALTTVAQKVTNSRDTQGGSGGASAVEKHLDLLTQKLDLSSDQQTNVKPILQEMQDNSDKFLQDESMSRFF